jgi:hypothetical protein
MPKQVEITHTDITHTPAGQVLGALLQVALQPTGKDLRQVESKVTIEDDSTITVNVLLVDTDGKPILPAGADRYLTTPVRYRLTEVQA